MSSSSTGVLTGTSITTSGGLTSGSTLTNSGAGGELQITGLASGINTNEIIQAFRVGRVCDDSGSIRTPGDPLAGEPDQFVRWKHRAIRDVLPSFIEVSG